MFRVKNLHPGSPSVPSGNAAAEAKPRCIYSISKPHGQSPRCQVRLLLPRRSRDAYIQFQNYMVRVPDAKSDCSCRGEAEVSILNFKTTWSEFQIPSPTASTEAKPRCLYSILKPHGQSSRYQVRILLLGQITIPHFRVSSPPQSRSKAVVCVSTPRMYPRSGYFLVCTIFELVFRIRKLMYRF